MDNFIAGLCALICVPLAMGFFLNATTNFQQQEVQAVVVDFDISKPSKSTTKIVQFKIKYPGMRDEAAWWSSDVVAEPDCANGIAMNQPRAITLHVDHYLIGGYQRWTEGLVTFCR